MGWRTDGAALPPPAEVLKAEKCARSRGRALPPAAPCSTYIEQAVHVGVYVCMYIATYILSVCVGVCVRELFKSKPCIKTNKQTNSEPFEQMNGKQETALSAQNGAGPGAAAGGGRGPSAALRGFRFSRWCYKITATTKRK